MFDSYNRSMKQILIGLVLIIAFSSVALSLSIDDKRISVLDQIIKGIPLTENKIEKTLRIKLGTPNTSLNPYYKIYNLNSDLGKIEVRLSKEESRGLMILDLQKPMKLSEVVRKYGKSSDVPVFNPGRPSTLNHNYAIKGSKVIFISDINSPQIVLQIVIDWTGK